VQYNIQIGTRRAIDTPVSHWRKVIEADGDLEEN
jgi:hypothetical protein